MKNILFFYLTLFLYVYSTASPIAPNQVNTLYAHLNEVNKEWSKFYKPENLQKSYAFKNEEDRIQMHLNLVENHLRQNTPKELNEQQLENRNDALDILTAYYKANCFPANHYHTSRQPYFIDNYGTACAVGHLIIETGFKSLAKQISKENNYAYISELIPLYPQIAKWAKEFGFTLEELAWIQPGYPPVPQEWNEVGNGGGVNGTINVIKSYNDERLYFAGDFTEIDGHSANSIAIWDGTNWTSLGSGVTGTIFDIELKSEGRVFIAGDFYINDDPEIVNLAYWENGNWNGYELTNMQGAIFSIHAPSGLMYFGGDFQFQNIDGDTIHNLCGISIYDGTLYDFDGDFSVNAPVRDFASVGNNILVVGDFTETGTYSDNPDINRLETSYMAYWNHIDDNWIQGFDQNLGTINSVLLDQGYIYVGKDSIGGLSPMGVFGNGLWQQYYPFVTLDSNYEKYVNGIIPFNNRIFFYGNFEFQPLIGTWTKGIYIISSNPELTYEEGADFNAPITAAEVFRDQIYFAGNFTSVQNQEFAGLVSSPFDGTTFTNEIHTENPINVYSSPSQINIQTASALEDFEIRFYNLSGQLITYKDLSSGGSDFSISTQSWVRGIYVYQAISKSGMAYSGKISVQ